MDRVINEMAKAKSDVEKRYREKIPEIIRECMAFAYLGKTFTFDVNADLEKRVNQRLIELSDEILADIEERAKKAVQYAEEEDDEDAILAYMKREQNGEDLITRIDKHNSNLRYFLEGWMAIGFANRLSQGNLFAQIMTYMGNPYASPLWQQAFKDGYLANSIRTQGYSFGRGNMKNPIDALALLEQDSINSAFQYGTFLRYGKEGAIGYTIHRGSGFDCPYCDSFTGIVHPMTECLLPLHPRCVCYSVPVYSNGSSVKVPAIAGARRTTAIAPPKKIESNKDWDVKSHGRGIISIHSEVNRSDSDFKDILDIAEYFAKDGSIVTITPKKTKNHLFDYDEVYESLKGTAFYGKCPDLNIDGFWYEHEGFITSNAKNAFRNMMRHGLSQSNRIIINDPGLTERHIKKSIWKRINQDKQDIVEVWIKREKELINLYKKQEE